MGRPLMVRFLSGVLIVVVITGCASAKVGISISDFKKSCWNASWQDATEVMIDDTNTVVICPVTGAVQDPQYQLFEDGILKRKVPENELIAMIEDKKCRSFGATPNTDAYINCRVSLAQMRAEAGQNEQLRRQNAAQYLLMLQAIQEPVNVKHTANCTATTIGNTTSYSCR